MGEVGIRIGTGKVEGGDNWLMCVFSCKVVNKYPFAPDRALMSD